MGRLKQMKIIEKIRQLITKKKIENKEAPNAKKKESNKIVLNRWGFPVRDS
tara:strand:+ start:235 stop:387 length:153 start_codon:yes stop_codon:yes gene_type:complete